MTEYTEVPYKEMELERMRIGMEAALSPELLDANINLRYDWVTDYIITQVRGYIWSEQLEHHEVRYPSDWWQAFKERWFKLWMLEKWPVKYKIHSIDLKAVFPSLKIETPNYKYYVRAFEDVDYSYLVRIGDKGKVKCE